MDKDIYKNNKYKNAIIKKNGSLKDNAPYLCSQWDYEKNGDLKPENVTCNSKLSVWWKCEYGHSWEARIGNRYKGCGCPYCSRELKTSFPEQAIYYYISTYFKNVENGYVIDQNEIDIYLKNEKIGIEYDGSFYHKSRGLREQEKYVTLKKNEIYLIRVREKESVPVELSCDDYILTKYIRNNFSDLDDTIKVLFEKINDITGKSIIPLVNSEKDRMKIQKIYFENKRFKSLEYKYPNIAKDWDYEKNGDLIPSMIYANDNRKYWWKCKYGHPYEMSANNRVNGRNCPICSNYKFEKGINDLKTKYPKLAEEFDTKENGILPSEIICTGKNKYWWKCSEGHLYQASIMQRIRNNSGCPYCSGLRAIKNENDFETVHPDRAKDWDYEKNSGKLPSDFKYGSGFIANWKCSKCGTEWQMAINLRHRGYGCPKCAKQKLSKLHSRAVIQYDLKGNEINRFSSITEAEKITGATHISMVCRGKRNQAGGYKWKYLDK